MSNILDATPIAQYEMQEKRTDPKSPIDDATVVLAMNDRFYVLAGAIRCRVDMGEKGYDRHARLAGVGGNSGHDVTVPGHLHVRRRVRSAPASAFPTAPIDRVCSETSYWSRPTGYPPGRSAGIAKEDCHSYPNSPPRPAATQLARGLKRNRARRNCPARKKD